jgi:hypothetical protein
LTGIAAGDVIPPKSAGPLTATSIVHSYAASQVVLLLKFRSSGFVTSIAGTVNLPSVCGNPIRPTVTLQSRCDDLLATVALPVGGYPVNVEVSGAGLFSSTLQLQPGAPAQSVAVPWQQADPVTVTIRGVTQLATARWANPPACLPPSVGSYQLLALANYRYVRATTEHDADGTVSPRAKANAKYLTADPTGVPLVASMDSIGVREKFTRYAPLAGPGPLLSMINGRYVTAEPTGTQPLIANREVVGRWEHFQIEDLGAGLVALKALVNGKYVCADGAGTKPLIANRATVGPWETFRLVTNADLSISFQATVNNKYVTAESAGAKPLIANRATIGPWEKFHEPF